VCWVRWGWAVTRQPLRKRGRGKSVEETCSIPSSNPAPRVRAHMSVGHGEVGSSDLVASAWRLALSLFGFGHIRIDRAAGMRVLGVLLWEDPLEHSGRVKALTGSGILLKPRCCSLGTDCCSSVEQEKCVRFFFIVTSLGTKKGDQSVSCACPGMFASQPHRRNTKTTPARKKGRIISSKRKGNRPTGERSAAANEVLKV
jgi:hypothetical protein